MALTLRSEDGIGDLVLCVVCHGFAHVTTGCARCERFARFGRFVEMVGAMRHAFTWFEWEDALDAIADELIVGARHCDHPEVGELLSKNIWLEERLEQAGHRARDQYHQGFDDGKLASQSAVN